MPHYRKHIRLPNYDYTQNGYYFVTICTHVRRPIFVAGISADAAAPSHGAKQADVAAPSHGATMAAQGAAATDAWHAAAPSHGATMAAQGAAATDAWHVAAPSHGATLSASAAQGAAATGDIKYIVEQKINQIPKYYTGVDVDYSVVMPTHVHIILILNDANVPLSKIINAFKSWVTRDVKRIVINGVSSADVAAPSNGANAGISAAQGAAATIAALAAQGAAATGATLAPRGAAVTARNIIWQPNYYEHVIRNEFALNKIRGYIINNPDRERYDLDGLDVPKK